MRFEFKATDSKVPFDMMWLLVWNLQLSVDAEGFCHHILSPESLAYLRQGPSEPSRMTSPPPQPIRQLNRVLLPPPTPCRDYPCPTSEAPWRIGFFFSLPLSLPCLLTSGKIDWGNSAEGGVVFRLWRLCKTTRGGKFTEGAKKTSAYYLTYKCCHSLKQASASCSFGFACGQA